MHSLSDESELWKRACNSIKSTFGRVFLYFFHLHKLFLLLHSNASIFLSMPQNSLYLLFSCTSTNLFIDFLETQKRSFFFFESIFDSVSNKSDDFCFLSYGQFETSCHGFPIFLHLNNAFDRFHSMIFEKMTRLIYNSLTHRPNKSHTDPYGHIWGSKCHIPRT